MKVVDTRHIQSSILDRGLSPDPLEPFNEGDRHRKTSKFPLYYCHGGRDGGSQQYNCLCAFGPYGPEVDTTDTNNNANNSTNHLTCPVSGHP